MNQIKIKSGRSAAISVDLLLFLVLLSALSPSCRGVVSNPPKLKTTLDNVTAVAQDLVLQSSFGDFESISLRTMQATQAALLEEIAALQVQVRELTSGGQVDYPNASFCGGEILHNLNSGTTATSVMSYSATAQDVYAFRIDPDTGTLFKVTVAQQLSYGERQPIGAGGVSGFVLKSGDMLCGSSPAGIEVTSQTLSGIVRDWVPRRLNSTFFNAIMTREPPQVIAMQNIATSAAIATIFTNGQFRQSVSIKPYDLHFFTADATVNSATITSTATLVASYVADAPSSSPGGSADYTPLTPCDAVPKYGVPSGTAATMAVSATGNLDPNVAQSGSYVCNGGIDGQSNTTNSFTSTLNSNGVTIRGRSNYEYAACRVDTAPSFGYAVSFGDGDGTDATAWIRESDMRTKFLLAEPSTPAHVAIFCAATGTATLTNGPNTTTVNLDCTFDCDAPATAMGWYYLDLARDTAGVLGPNTQIQTSVPCGVVFDAKAQYEIMAWGAN